VPTSQILDAEGLVFQDGAFFFFEKDGQAQPLDFSIFEGQEVQALIAHVPSQQQKDRWGFGSCAFQTVGFCPFGHHLNPHKLFSMSGSGTLQKIGDWWGVSGLDFPPRDTLVGHRCRVLIVPHVFHVEDSQVSDQLSELILTLSKLKNSR